MKTRIIVELENTGDEHRTSLRGECEGENDGSVVANTCLMLATAILKRRIAKVVDGFGPEGVTLAEIAEINNCYKEVKQ